MRMEPDDVRVALKDAIVRRRSGLPPVVDDEELFERALSALEELKLGRWYQAGCECDCHGG